MSRTNINLVYTSGYWTAHSDGHEHMGHNGEALAESLTHQILNADKQAIVNFDVSHPAIDAANAPHPRKPFRLIGSNELNGEPTNKVLWEWQAGSYADTAVELNEAIEQLSEGTRKGS